MSRFDSCPVCLNQVPGWAAACPKCRYHPDGYSNSCYNRAQDDIALLFRLSSAACSECPPTPAQTPGWRSWLPHWLGGSSGAGAGADPVAGAQPPRPAA